MNKTKTLALVLLTATALTGCGKKSREPGDATKSPNPGIVNTPFGMEYSKNKAFLLRKSFVKPSTTAFVVEANNTVLYEVLTSELQPLETGVYGVEVDYDMPEMPAMPVVPPVVDFTRAGQIRVTYNISMGGLWRFRLKLKKDGQIVDSYEYRVTL